MLDTVTPAQREAIINRGGKLLVSAAAGSGKTMVLVERLVEYILDPVDPANIDDFLIITYTKAAAAELRSKIAARLSKLIAEQPNNRHLQQQMQRLYLAKISTVHGFCTDVLRQYAHRLDISADFRVADEGECAELQLKAIQNVLDAAYESADDNALFRELVDSQGIGRDDKQIPEIILKVYGSARCHLDPDGWLDWCASFDLDSVTDVGQTPWGQYLIADLKAYLKLLIDAMERCMKAASLSSGMEKPIALFESNIVLLQSLYDCETWDSIVDSREMDFGSLRFNNKCTDLQLCEQLKAVRNACKTGLATRLKNFVDKSELLLADLKASRNSALGIVELVQKFSDEYDRLKKNRGILDFGDLEHKTLDLFAGKQRKIITSVAREVGERFREVMVDEYQDSNGIQDAIFNALTEKRQNCFMVGDVKQSIYQFRLADPGIFTQKYLSYVPAKKANVNDGRKVLLSHNFRSSAGVLSGVNDVFTRCMSADVGGIDYGEEEMLREGVSHIPMLEPEVSLYGISAVSDVYDDEAVFVANQIVSLLDGNHFVRDGDTLRAVRPEDIVILLRSPGSVGATFQEAVLSRGVRCVSGDSANILQTEEVQTVLSILQIINNPLQDIPLAAALTSPVFGFTAEDLANLRIGHSGDDLYTLLSKSANEKSKRFVTVLLSLREHARFETVAQLLSRVYTETNLLSIYAAMDDGAIKLDNLQAFFQIASDYETSGPRELTRFLDFLEASKQRGLGVSAAGQDSDAVMIMSIHKSKGLEFPIVFLSGLSRGFNAESLKAQVLCDKDLGLGLGCVDAKHRVRYPTVAKRAISTKIKRQGASEELRVLYVAMTRAKDRLIMTYSSKRLEKDLQEISMRLDMTSPQLLAMDVGCPGEWVLQTALTRTEAGEFFALGGHPNCAAVQDNTWKIAVVDGDCIYEEPAANEDTQMDLPQMDDRFTAKLHFRYPYASATTVPSKLTATQLKGRALDTEVSDGTADTRPISFRRAGIAAKKSGTTYGNAIHTILQYIRFGSCGSVESIRQEVDRLVNEKLISQEQADMADCESLYRFFDSPFGKKLQEEKEVLREFKFSILDDASKYYPGAKDEQVLLQGVVDCAIIEDDGITVIDFKTDYVTDKTLSEVADKYRPQVRIYASAVERIYQKQVKKSLLYFFALNCFVEV